MQIVNINYRGYLNRTIDLHDFYKKFSNSTYYPLRPNMVRIKDENATILFFNSGRFRVMGCNSLKNAKTRIQKYSDQSFNPKLKVQSMTAKMKLNHEVNVTS